MGSPDPIMYNGEEKRSRSRGCVGKPCKYAGLVVPHHAIDRRRGGGNGKPQATAA